MSFLKGLDSMLVSDLYEGERSGREGEEMEDDDELDHVCPFFFFLLATAIQGILDAADLVLKEKCMVLVSVGGGSPIDAAKVSSSSSFFPLPSDLCFLSADEYGVFFFSRQAISYFVKEKTKSSTFMPQVAIPTTLSAAEMTMNAGTFPFPFVRSFFEITAEMALDVLWEGYSDEKGNKVGVADPQIVPRVSSVDA